MVHPALKAMWRSLVRAREAPLVRRVAQRLPDALSACTSFLSQDDPFRLTPAILSVAAGWGGADDRH